MRIKSLDNRGQAAWFDIIIIFLCITIFTASIWAFSLGGKAPKSQSQRSRQDFTNSLLLSILYNTLDGENPKYRGKSVSDIIGMYFAAGDEERVSVDFVIESLKHANIHKYLGDKGSSKNTNMDWFLYGEGTELCIHGKGDSIEKCKGDVGVSSTRSVGVDIVFPTGENKYKKIPVYLIVKWGS